MRIPCKIAPAGLCLGALLLAACFVTESGVGSRSQGRVIKVADGDSLTVEIEGQAVEVRLFGIDSPERGQPFSRPAKTFLSSRILGRDVRLKVIETDRYGRSVATVFTMDGEEVGAAMLEAGMAWWFRRYASHRGDYAGLEEEARRAKRGLWAAEDPVPPWEWRERRRNR